MTHGSVRIVERRPAEELVVFLPVTVRDFARCRSPRGARPRSLAILVEVSVSSMNEDQSISAHAAPLAARSGRSGSAARTLFEADDAAVEDPPWTTPTSPRRQNKTT
jgi:hypothetical protein